MFKKKSKQTNEPKSLRHLKRFELFVLNNHTYFEDGRYRLRRTFQLSACEELNNLCKNFTNISAMWFIVDFVNKFITEEALDPTKTTDDEVIQFFAYAYSEYEEKITLIDQSKVETWIKKLMKFNPKFFNDKHLDNDYKYEIYLLFKKMFESGLDVDVKNPYSD